MAGSGAWIATSGSDSSAAYELDVTDEVAHGCNCLVGLNGDPVCKHRAAFYLAVGLLDPEPEPPAPALDSCGYCSGRGWEIVTGKSGTDYRFACPVCDGAGTVTGGDADDEPAVAAGPVAVAPALAAPAVCGRCVGTAILVMRVATALDVYPITRTCRACGGIGVVEPASAIAA